MSTATEKICIQNAHIINPAENFDGISNLYLAKQKIVTIHPNLTDFTPDRIIDATGLLVIPGLVDLNLHLKSPEIEPKFNFNRECEAAQANGITTLCCPPHQRPYIDTPAVAKMVHHSNKQLQILPIGSLSKELAGEHLSEMVSLQQAGCIAVSNGVYAISDTLVLRRALEYASTHDLLVFIYAQDHWLQRHGCMHEGKVSLRLGLTGIPEAAETIAIARDLALIEQTGVRAHFCRLSCHKSVEMVSKAQQQGLPVTADVSISHLYLTDMDVADFNTNCHVIPPLRTEQDQLGLKQGIANGTIQAICSDHTPLTQDAKLAPFPSSLPGISSLDSFIPLALRLVNDNTISLSQMVSLLSWQPAQILQINAGSLNPDVWANICIIDTNTEWTLTQDNMYSQAYNTPFLGWPLQGRVKYTLYRGEVVYQDSSISIN